MTTSRKAESADAATKARNASPDEAPGARDLKAETAPVRAGRRQRARPTVVPNGENGSNVVPMRETYDVRLRSRPLEQAQRIARAQQVTEGEVVKRALALLDFVQTALDDGSTIWVKDASGHSREVQFFFG